MSAQKLPVDRREFIKQAGAGVAACAVAGATPLLADQQKQATAESLVQVLYESFSPKQKEAVCFDWNHMDEKRGLLRTRVSANWQITDKSINDDEFYTKDQQHMMRQIFERVIQPQWHARFDQQMEDDCGGWGQDQALAIFGKPGDGKFEFVLTGRHMTLRCDGNSEDHMAFGGPVFYGHSADESSIHDGNVFWHQAVKANQLFAMLDGKQRDVALISKAPVEKKVSFRGPNGQLPGIPVSELSGDQQEHMRDVLKSLIEPFRTADQNEVTACLKAQGGLESCSLSFYEQGNLGDDEVWDNWRLEGPSFVWYFRGSPHVHCWVHVADVPSVKLNS